MIISTNKSDTMLKRCLDRNQSIVISIEKMIEQFVLDPTTCTPPRTCYIVTNEDISAKRLKEQFEQQLMIKHPNTKVIFINKSSRPMYQNGLQGLDVVLQKPKPQDITSAISVVTASGNVTSMVAEQLPQMPEIPTYTPDPPASMTDTSWTEPDPIPEPVPEEVSEPEELYVPQEPESDPQPEIVPEVQPSGIVDRVRSAGSVSDVSVVMREITATSLIKDLYATNSTYAGIEEKLKSLNDTIFAIMSDNSIRSLDEKLTKVHALLHDKAFFRAQGDTLIEQRLEEVIDVICTRTSELLQSRLSEIDSAIRKSISDKELDNGNARLAGLGEERANIIIELQTLEIEVTDIYKATDGLIMDTVTDIAAKSSEPTGSDRINDILKARGNMIMSEETVDAIRCAMECSKDKVPSAFKMMKQNVIGVVMLMRKLFDVDQEIIAAQQKAIEFLRSNNVEDTVVAETLLKKSLRVYVGEDKVGRTIIPYLISKYRSRQNANVLLIDLTGSAKYSEYGIQYTNLDSYLNDMQQREFMLAVGSIDNSIASAQRLVTTILKAADYYRVINIVMTMEQKELFDTIVPDVLSINFLVDTNVTRLNNMRDFIASCSNHSNVARRVIINRCDVPIRPIITRLGLDDCMDIQTCVIPTVSVLVESNLGGYDPYGISSVDLIMEEVLKHA